MPRLAITCLLPLLIAPAHPAHPEADAGERGPWRRAGLPTSGVLRALAVAPDTGALALADARGVLLAEPGGGALRVVRHDDVRDLAFAADALWIATGSGLQRWRPGGDAVEIPLAPGEMARNVNRILTVDGLRVAGTEAGAFVSGDRGVWSRLSGGVPAGPVRALALRRDGADPVLWLVVDGRVWSTRLAPDGAGWRAGPARREGPGVQSDAVGIVDLALPPEDRSAWLLLEDAVVVRDGEGEPWRRVPGLPPGARARRLARAGGALWALTDHGALHVGAGGDERGGARWRRADPPAGSAAAVALAEAGGVLWLATESGLLRSEPAPATASPSGGAPPPDLLLRHRHERREPGVADVRRAALHHLGLGRARLLELRERVRRRGWLPSLSLRLSHDRRIQRGDDFDQAFTSGAYRALHDRDRDRQSTLEASLELTWDLGDTAYHPEEIDASREGRELLQLRDDILDELHQIYFERRRVVLELALLPDPGSPEAARLRLRADELGAGLDAWTGGWFGRRVRPLSR